MRRYACLTPPGLAKASNEIIDNQKNSPEGLNKDTPRRKPWVDKKDK